MAEQTVREAVGVFQDATPMQTAVDELLLNGFDRSTLSMMATSDTVERELGHRYQRVEELVDDPNARMSLMSASIRRSPDRAPRLPGSPMSGLAPPPPSLGVPAEGLAPGSPASSPATMRTGCRSSERGGILLWARTMNERCEKLACDILDRHGAANAHAHDLPAPLVQAEAGGVSDNLALVDKP